MSSTDWSNLLENSPREFAVEQFLWTVDLSGRFQDESEKSEAIKVKDILFSCAELFPKSKPIQTRVYKHLQDILNASDLDSHSIFTESDLLKR